MVTDRVSVAVCTHQGAAFVGRQLESILEQTRPPDEVVVSDDASTDGTVELVEDMARGASVPLRLRSNPRPLGFRRNFEGAIGECSGDVVFLSDQDDVWLPEKIEAMLPAFTEDAAIVHCDAVLAGPDLEGSGETVFGRHPPLGGGASTPLEVIRGMGIPGCTMAFRSELREVLVPFSGLWGHDLWIALVGGALGDVVPVDRRLMLYRRHSAGAGPSRHLDVSASGRLREGLRTRRPDDYGRDRAKWHQVVDRLDTYRRGLPPADPRGDRLDAFLEEYRRRYDLALFRYGVRRRPRVARLGPVLRRVASGDYRRFLRPVASPVKDALS